ncbi:MAG TPA: hypothetical protein VH478_02040 [Trebonia sp.]|jgi:hypothetical protein|nr:hypothetical protein [Trebonia sp.]
MDEPDGTGDEIAIDPLPLPRVPVPPAVARIAGRLPRVRLLGDKRRPTRAGWVAAAIALLVVLGVLKLSGTIWTAKPPSWEAALGPGVTVTGPGLVTPGHDSPGAAATGLVSELSSGDQAAFCRYVYAPPSEPCTAQNSPDYRGRTPYTVSFKVGYVAIAGTRALVGFTGKLCFPGARTECESNADPAAIFSGGRTFEALWAEPSGGNPADIYAYGLLTCIKIGGRWYFGSSAPAGASSR